MCCPNKHTKSARKVLHVHDVRNEEPDETFHLGSISFDHTDDPWIVTLNVCNQPVNFKIDTCADITIMSDVTFSRIPRQPKLTPVSLLLLSPERELNYRGKFITNVAYKGCEYSFSIYVVEGPQNSDLLARNVAHKLELICRVDETSVFGSCGLV